MSGAPAPTSASRRMSLESIYFPVEFCLEMFWFDLLRVCYYSSFIIFDCLFIRVGFFRWHQTSRKRRHQASCWLPGNFGHSRDSRITLAYGLRYCYTHCCPFHPLDRHLPLSQTHLYYFLQFFLFFTLLLDDGHIRWGLYNQFEFFCFFLKLNKESEKIAVVR